MATPTLAEISKQIPLEHVRAVAEDIITLDSWFVNMPFIGFSGVGLKNNRENTMGDVGFYSIGDPITHTNPAVVDELTWDVTKLIGQVEMDTLVFMKSNDSNRFGLEMQSKAKNIGRQFQQGLMTGTGVAPQVNSLHSMCDATQYTPTSAGQNLSFALLDTLMDLPTSKGGTVDFLVGHGSQVNRFRELYRALGGSEPSNTVFELPDGTTQTVVRYRETPFYKNDFQSVAETADGAATTGGALTSVYAGNWDPGDRATGLSGIFQQGVTPDGQTAGAGIIVMPVGVKAAADETMWRLLAYWNAALFNRRGLARLTSLNV